MGSRSAAVLGTCQSVGCLVDGKPPHDIIDAMYVLSFSVFLTHLIVYCSNEGEIEVCLSRF